MGALRCEQAREEAVGGRERFKLSTTDNGFGGFFLFKVVENTGGGIDTLGRVELEVDGTRGDLSLCFCLGGLPCPCPCPGESGGSRDIEEPETLPFSEAESVSSPEQGDLLTWPW